MSSTNTAVMKSVLIADCETDSIIYSFPTEISPNIISDMKSIFNSFKEISKEKQQDSGKVASREGFLYWFLFPSKYFIVVNTNNYYKENRVKEFVNQINNELINKEYINIKTEGKKGTAIIQQEGKEYLLKMFEIYKVLNNNGNVSDVKIEDIDVSKYFEDNSVSINTVRETERSMLPERRNSFEDMGEEIFPDEEIKVEEKLFRKDANELKKVAWWRTMKLIFIIICILFAIVLYISVPIVMKNKKYFDQNVNQNNSTNNSSSVLFIR